MIRSAQIVVGFLLLLGAWQVVGARTAMPSTLATRPIIEALHEAGIEAAPRDIEFVGLVPVSDPTAAVRITGWRPLNVNTLWVRLACRRAQDCLPFFIQLHVTDANSIPLRLVAPEVKAQLASSKKARRPVLIRAGSHAILLLQRGRAHIRTSVICLDSGERGGRIRVRNLSTKRILSAEIVDHGLVQAWY